MRVLLAVLLTLPLAAQDDPRIAEGTKLHDAGRYDEAIAVYRAILADQPNNIMATYELGFSLMVKGDYAQCVSVLEPAANKPTRLQVPILTGLTSCLDHAGDTPRAIETYRKGLKLAPNDPGLLYNLAVTLAAIDKYDEARELLKKELTVRPGHASGRYLLARVFAAQNFRTPAIVEYLRFLALEPGGERAKESAGALLGLLDAGVVQKDAMNTLITLDPKPRVEEGDFSAFGMALAIAAGARFTPEQQKKSEFEIRRDQVASVIQMFEEQDHAGGNYTVERNAPFFTALEREGLVDTFAGLAISSLELKGMAEWQRSNADALRKLETFLKR